MVDVFMAATCIGCNQSTGQKAGSRTLPLPIVVNAICNTFQINLCSDQSNNGLCLTVSLDETKEESQRAG